MKLTGWGQYPAAEATLIRPATIASLSRVFSAGDFRGIARGLGRSYGDSALADQVIDCTGLDDLIDFDPDAGLLTAAAGFSIADLLRIFVPLGWFPAVSPGTKHVTLGGAVASDVHGKNHHLAGAFSDHLQSIRLLQPDGEQLDCSRSQNAELFHATAGGMGLTGIITEVSLKLAPIESAWMEESTILTGDLRETMDVCAEHGTTPYVAAWIDANTTAEAAGAGVVSIGRHAGGGELSAGRESGLAVPFVAPFSPLNKWSGRAFNHLYRWQGRRRAGHRRVHYEPFLYPLDGLGHWHRLYGPKGLVQYQFVVPDAAAFAASQAILSRILRSRHAVLLAVLKAFGAANANPLSFPMAGYTLALDFKRDRYLNRLLKELDRIVLDHGGRIYLAKDARMSEKVFKSGYPRWTEFAQLRQKFGLDRHFNSLQSNRLGI